MAVLAMAAIALVLLLVPRGDIAPIGGASPTASATAQPTPALEPSASLTPSPTLAPTPQPTPAPPAVWTGLTWSDPVTPPFIVHLNDLLPWDDGYVAVGSVEVDATRSEAAFLTSPDGSHWTITEQRDLGIDRFRVTLSRSVTSCSHSPVVTTC